MLICYGFGLFWEWNEDIFFFILLFVHTEVNFADAPFRDLLY